MTEVQTMQQVLFHEIEVGVRSTQNLLLKIRDQDWDYRPHENMRSIRELVEHLISIPAVDLYILQEEPHESIKALEDKYSKLNSVDDMNVVFEDGYNKLNNYMTSLSNEEFLNKKTKAFYMENGQTQATWLTEILTHIFHHRGQLFNYLKQLDYEVSMFDLYV
ncbi:damage-inducible protein DinB [Halalkalibacillus sediminis]|uniref:Damage-inducible protein DinB n=1 Tax=Halalkalibacillus sediminis TaxID=2018042 RepID=A0A2I0QRZ1_9BACI|nr:DinB family protein [Halalkalibacillus sediminis]PKR77106.1 damage-inducible protein DinB [Halalkalibacillus sediminis]